MVVRFGLLSNCVQGSLAFLSIKVYISRSQVKIIRTGLELQTSTSPNPAQSLYFQKPREFDLKLSDDPFTSPFSTPGEKEDAI